MDPFPVYERDQTVWLWVQLEGTPLGGHWTQGRVTRVFNSTSGSARTYSYTVSYTNRHNQHTSTTVGPHMIRARSGLLPSHDGL